MGSTAFPSNEMRKLASFEARLGEDLSLSTIEEIETQIADFTTDNKTRGIAINLLNRFEAKKTPLVDRQIQKLDQASDPVAKIKLLTPLMGYLEPDTVNEKFEAIQMAASLSSNKKVRDAVAKQLEHFKFAQEKPIIADLDVFAANALKVSSAVQRMQSFAPLSQFNAPQILEVQRAIARNG